MRLLHSAKAEVFLDGKEMQLICLGCQIGWRTSLGLGLRKVNVAFSDLYSGTKPPQSAHMGILYPAAILLV